PRAVKRFADIVIASVILTIGVPVWLLVALAIKLDSAGPVLFSQRRNGYRGEQFDLLKFRSMRVETDQVSAGQQTHMLWRSVLKEKRDPRITRVGRLIRPFSIDEIPQLINVLRGEMSVIGPRPVTVDRQSYEDWELARFNVRPGLTGLWQVRGRSN